MPHPSLAPEILRALEARIEELGYECVDVQMTLEGGRRILRIILDSDHGVGLDECASVSRQLSPVLDEFENLPKGYYLEVSSPGINRPLTKPEHYRRFQGEPARIRLREKLEGGLTVTGILGELENDILSIETTSGVRHVPLRMIARARLHRDLGQFLKPRRD